MKKILKKNEIYDFYINTNMTKNYLHNMTNFFPVLSYLVRKFKDELKNQLKSLTQHISLNKWQLSINDSFNLIAGLEEDSFGGV